MQSISSKHSQLDLNDGNAFGPYGTIDRGSENAGATELEGEDHDLADELQLYSSHEDEYDIFELRIIHRKNRLQAQTISLLHYVPFMLNFYMCLETVSFTSGLASRRTRICQLF